MDRAPEPGERAWSLLVVPRLAGPGVRHLHLDGVSLARLRACVAALALAVVVLACALALAGPRVRAYPALIEENLAMRTELRGLERDREAALALLLRLRIYEAQLRGLSGTGGHGPLDEVPPTGDPLGEGPWIDASPEAAEVATTRAAAVAAELSAMRSVLSVAEGDIRGLVGHAVALEALEAALPSTWPAKGLVSSPFGYRREPFGSTWRFHGGLDIAGERGDPVFAAGPGTVVRAEVHSGYGRVVEVDHGFGIVSVYAHCQRIRVRSGEVVRRGQPIATMGSTGRSTGPHLHFEVRVDGHPINPVDLLAR